MDDSQESFVKDGAEMSLELRGSRALSMHRCNQHDQPAGRFLALMALITFVAWVSKVRRADSQNVDNVDSVSADLAPVAIFNNENGVRMARISAHRPNRDMGHASSGHRAQGRRRVPRSEDGQVLEVPQAIGPPTQNSAGGELKASRQDKDDDVQLGPASPASGARQSFSGIARPLGTMRDYENQAKEPRAATACTASQWWWTSGVAVCTPIASSPSSVLGAKCQAVKPIRSNTNAAAH